MGRDRKLKCLMIVAFRCCFVLSCTGLLACGLASAAVPSAAAPQASDTSLIRSQPMFFSVAKGEPNACGPGCSEWIAAEGAIDSDAPKRLRTFLTSLADRCRFSFIRRADYFLRHWRSAGFCADEK
jgi:hypothetical protein